MLTRPLGRPKNRWEDDIINDMKRLKIKKWTGCIQDRNKYTYSINTYTVIMLIFAVSLINGSHSHD